MRSTAPQRSARTKEACSRRAGRGASSKTRQAFSNPPRTASRADAEADVGPRRKDAGFAPLAALWSKAVGPARVRATQWFRRAIEQPRILARHATRLE